MFANRGWRAMLSSPCAGFTPVVRRLYRYSLSFAWKTVKYLDSGCSSSCENADLKSIFKNTFGLGFDHSREKVPRFGFFLSANANACPSICQDRSKAVVDDDLHFEIFLYSLTGVVGVNWYGWLWRCWCCRSRVLRHLLHFEAVFLLWRMSGGCLFFTYRLIMFNGIAEIAFAGFCSTVFDMFYYRCSDVLSAVVACSWFPCLRFLFHVFIWIFSHFIDRVLII